MRFKTNVEITKFSNDVLKAELLKYKDLNSYYQISKAKLIDYAVAKTFNTEYLKILKKESDFKKLFEVYEKDL